MKVNVRIPATSANLGPGFDTLGIALNYYDEYEAETTDSGLQIIIEGEGVGDIPTDETNLVFKALSLVFERMGEKVPGLKLTTRNHIPHGRGMGSSGAAVAGGIMLAAGLLGKQHVFTEQQLLDFATVLEGHPDNVAPALFGGMTIAWTDSEGPHHKQLRVHRGVSPIVMVPPNQMSTKLARSLQPESVPHEDAVFNLSRSALLVAALISSPELMLPATEDRLHQDYRASAMPETQELIVKLRELGHPAVVSGAGPSVLILEPNPEKRLEVQAFAEKNYPHWQVLMLAVDSKGATVEVHEE